MGRRPKPTATKVLNGNPGKRPLPKREPKPKAGTTCPSHLSADAKKEWARIAPELDRLNLLTLVDRAALAAYCQVYARWCEAEQALRDEGGLLVKAPTGYPIQNPYLAIANKALDQMKTYLIEFGLTPASRSGVEGAIAVPPSESPNEPKGKRRGKVVQITDRLGRPA